jgi:hypothetical protein
MKEPFSIFRKYPTLEQAEEIESLLKENNIETILADNIPPVDITFSGSTINNEYEIRINQFDFEKAESILEKNAEKLIDEVDKDYYLFDFTNDELYEILLKSDEWSSFDYTLAQQILKKKGKSIDKDLLLSLKNERLKQLAKPEENQKPWIIVGYLFSILGGFLGMIIGYFLWTAKKTLPNGEKVYSYLEKDRIQGKYIFYIGVIIFPISLLFKILAER